MQSETPEQRGYELALLVFLFTENFWLIISSPFLFSTIESLYEELVREGILVQYPKVQIKDYLGEYSYLGTTLRQANIEPMPSLSDVRRVITEYCILPLGKQQRLEVLSVSYFSDDLFLEYHYASVV